MSELVKALVVEINGNPQKLQQALRAAGYELKQFKEKGAQSSASVAGGADMMANKFAAAGRAGASAMETIARTGKASGEAVKQLIAQGANAALFFGPQGALVGAVGITTLAITEMFQRTRNEISETQQRAVEAANAFAEMDANAQATAYNRSFFGPPNKVNIRTQFATERFRLADADTRRSVLQDRGTIQLKADIDALEVEEARRRSQLSGAGSGGAGGAGAVAAADALAAVQSKLKEVRAAYDELRARQPGMLKQLQASTALQWEGVQVLASAKDATKDATSATRDREQATKELNRELEQLAETTARLVSGTLATLEDRVRAPFDEAIEKSHELARALAQQGRGGEVPAVLAQADRIAGARDVAVQSAGALARATEALVRFEELVAERGAPSERAIRELRGAISDLADDSADLVEGSEPYVKHLEKQRQMERELTEALEKRAAAQRDVSEATAGRSDEEINRSLKGALDELEKGRGGGGLQRDLADVAREMHQSADGALQLMENLAGAEEHAIGTLRAVAQIAGNAPAMAGAIGALRAGKTGGSVLTAASLGGILTAALPIVGALSSLLGDSPEEQARRDELRRNTAAIKALTAKAGLLGTDVTGGEATRALRDARALQKREIDTGTIDYANLRKVASGFGIELGDGLTGLGAFIEALEGSIMKLAEFSAELDGQEAQAELEIALLGITDPIERLAVRMGAFAGRSPALDRVTAGLDLSTAEGRAQARANVAALFEIMKAGGATLSEEDLGGLSGSDLSRALSQLVDALDELDNASGTAAGSSIGVVSGYTGLSAAGGARIEDYNRALVSFARDAASARTSILDRLDTLLAHLLAPVPTIPLAAAAAGGVAGGLVIQTINIEFVVQVVGGANPQATGAAVATAIGERIGDEFYRAIRAAQQAAGNLSVAGTR